MEVTTIGIDLAKNVFAVSAADETGRVILRRQLRRHQVLGFRRPLNPAWWAWRRAAARITGPARSADSGMR
jgi:hypothetical protein